MGGRGGGVKERRWWGREIKETSSKRGANKTNTAMRNDEETRSEVRGRVRVVWGGKVIFNSRRMEGGGVLILGMDERE